MKTVVSWWAFKEEGNQERVHVVEARDYNELKFNYNRIMFRLKQIDMNGYPTVSAWQDLMWEVKRLENPSLKEIES